MTTRTAALPERSTFALIAVTLAKTLGRTIAHNPVIAGGTTAFAISMLFFSANALWYQPYAQKNAFFQTRPNPFVQTESAGPSTTGSIRKIIDNRIFVKAPSDPAPTPVPAGGDPVVAKVQGILAGLQLYSGDIDGLQGPQTRDAIEAYQNILGLEPTGKITDQLLQKLDAQIRAPAGTPVPSPAPRDGAAFDAKLNATHTSSVASLATQSAAGNDIVVKVQAGLRAFGNDRIDLDGVLGEQTQAAIREFQSLFGLPVTGQIDDRLVAKMEEVGLIGN